MQFNDIDASEINEGQLDYFAQQFYKDVYNVFIVATH